MTSYVFIESGVELTDLYIYLSVILFVCLTSVASTGIQIIIEDVRFQAPKLHNEFGHRVRKWKHDYGLIHDFIEEIDAFFGPTLLLFSGRMFAFFVFKFFELSFVKTKSDTDSELTSSIDVFNTIEKVIYLSKIILYISMLSFRSQKLKHQVFSFQIFIKISNHLSTFNKYNRLQLWLKKWGNATLQQTSYNQR